MLSIDREYNQNYTNLMQISFQDLQLTGVPFTTVDTGSGAEPSISGIEASFDSPKSATLALNSSDGKRLNCMP